MRISAPVAHGSGAFIMHQALAECMEGYVVSPYHPYLSLVPPLIRRFADRRADLVHAPVDYAFFCRLPGKPLVSTFHSFLLDSDTLAVAGPIQRLHYRTDLKWFINKGLEHSTLVTTVSHYVARKVQGDLGYTGTIRVVHNGVDTQLFHPSGVRAAEGPEVNVLYCGSVMARKGAGVIPRILDHLDPRIRFNYASGLRSGRARIAHARANSLGRIRYADMPALYRSADMLLFPSFSEGFGLAVAEAMACGLPVVASNCSALPELIDDGLGGYLCRPGDAADFADKINRLAADPELRGRMGEYNRAKAAERFCTARMANGYREVFEEALSAGTGSLTPA